MQSLLQDAPCLTDYLDDDSQQHFSVVCQQLKAAGIDYEINPRLVRGLDYYNKTVFEWVTNELGSQGTVCGGGRYDSLVEQLGGQSTYAVGFSLGMERLVELVSANASNLRMPQVDICFVLADETVTSFALTVAEKLRDKFPQLQIISYCGGGGIKSQLKRADKIGAHWAIIIGENELLEKKVTLKSLRVASEQQLLSLDSLLQFDFTLLNS